MMKKSGIGLLVTGLILGACTTAPVAKNKALDAGEGNLARRKQIEAEADRFLAQIEKQVARAFGDKLGTIVGYLPATLQKESTDLILARAAGYGATGVTKLSDLSERLSEKDMKSLVTEVITHPGLFRLTEDLVNEGFSAELKSLAETGSVVPAEVVAKNLPSAYKAGEVQEITNAIFTSNLTATNLPRDVRKKLTVDLAMANERVYQALGEPAINKNACGLAQGLSPEAVGNVIELYERQVRDFKASGMSEYCYKNAGVAKTFDAWYRETLGGTAATEAELIAAEGERAVALKKECELLPGYLAAVGATMAATKAFPYVPGCPLR